MKYVQTAMLNFSKLNIFFILLIFTVSFIGCEEKFPVYSTFCDSSLARPECLRYPMLAKEDISLLENSLGLKDNSQCADYVKFTRYQAGSCNNPVVKSTGSDFEGYVRIEIFRGLKCYYKVQSDYKHDPDAALKRIIQQIKKDLKIKKSFN